MTDDLLQRMRVMIQQTVSHMREAEVTTNANGCQVIIHTDKQGVALVEKFLISSPINMATLIGIITTVKNANKECLILSKEIDSKNGLKEDEPSKLTELLNQIVSDKIMDVAVQRDMDESEDENSGDAQA